MLIGVWLPFLGTALGAACVFLLRDGLSERVNRALLGFASGVMVAASVWSLLIPAMEQCEAMGRWAFAPAAGGFLLGIAILLLSYFVLYKTRLGLRLRACGEHPQAADSVGINVYKMRYIGVLISGALGGIGGMAYIIPSVSSWNFEVGVSGAGFLALAVMIFGQWKPFRICFAAMFFALFKSLANIASSIPAMAALGWTQNMYNMIPFIASMIILAFTSKKSRAPKAEGIPYDKGSR